MFNEYPHTDLHELNLDWIIKKVKELAAAWAQVQKDWTDEQAAFANLQSWIENYFNNLDVQTEINVKLDSMVVAGTMSELIAPYVASGLPAEVADQITDVVAAQIGPVVAAQISAVVADQLPAVAAAAAAQEVSAWLALHVNPETGYVIDDTFTIQGAAADAKAVGDEFTAIKSALTSVVDTIPSVQLFDRSKSTDGRMDKDGTISGVGSYVHSEKINVEGNTGRTIYFSVDNIEREANRVCAFVGENVDSSLGANTVPTYTIPATVTDIIISYSTSQTRFQAQYDKKTSYVPYGDTYKAKTDKTLTHEDEIADAKAVGDRFDSEKLTGLVVSVDSDNMCNPDEVVSGLLQSNGTVDNTGNNANYDTSGYIKVEGLTNANISAWTNTGTIVGGRKRTALFDANKQFISGSYTDDSSVDNKTVTVNNAVYVRFSYENAASKTNMGMCVDGSTVPEAFVKYHHEDQLNNDIFLNDTEKGQIPIYASGLNGKKWCPCGDSFTYGSESAIFDDGIYKGKNKVYPYFIGNRTGIDVQGKFFYSGRTLAYPSDGTFDNSICNPSATYYYQNIPADAYLVTFYLGINDHHHSTGDGGGDGEETTGVITLGTPDSVDTSTYYGAWNTVLTWLRTNRPFAHIGIIVTNGVPQEWREAQIAMARKYGVPFIDLNGDDRTPCMLRSCNANIPEAVRNTITANQRVSVSNAHPNDDAHEFESWFIETFIKTI